MANETSRIVQKGLAETFGGVDEKKHNKEWSKLWDEGNVPWDQGHPSPALVDTLERNKDLFNPYTLDGRRKKVLVPGCGRGYDVVMFALHGFDAYGLDVSETGISEAKKFAASELKEPQDFNFGSFRGTDKTDVGSVSWFTDDFFADWNKGTQFDIIYDYTFLCALSPSMRKNWADRMAELLNRNGGLLVCLEFPLFKDLAAQGPPWGLKGVHWDLLTLGNDGILHTRTEPTSEEEKGKFRRVVYLKPERSNEMSQGTDLVSIYNLK